jgi:ABC-2 type transport system permease protein
MTSFPAIAAIVGREVRSNFLSPVGYIVAALFALATGLIFLARTFEQGQPTTLRLVFEWGTWLLLFVCPAISMRAIAEEKRMGTWEMLMSCPISERGIVIGKFLGGMAFLAMILLPTVALVIALERYGRPDYGEVACGYLGLLLAGAAYLASGLLASALTTSQIIAFLLTLFFWLGLSLSAKLLPAYLPGRWADVAFAADPDPRLRDFAIGLLDTSNVVFFVTLTLLFLIAATRVLAAGRWR